MSDEQMTELGQSDQACYLVVAMAVKNPGTAPAGVTSEKLDRVADSVWRDGS